MILLGVVMLVTLPDAVELPLAKKKYIYIYLYIKEPQGSMSANVEFFRLSHRAALEDFPTRSDGGFPNAQRWTFSHRAALEFRIQFFHDHIRVGVQGLRSCSVFLCVPLRSSLGFPFIIRSSKSSLRKCAFCTHSPKARSSQE